MPWSDAPPTRLGPSPVGFLSRPAKRRPMGLDLAALGRGGAYAIVAAAALVEAIPVAGLLLPGGIVIGGAAALAAQGGLDLVVVSVIALAGSIVGDAVGFMLGRRFGLSALARWPGLRRVLTPARQDMLRARLRERPTFAVSAARFQYPVRCLVPFLAGAAHVPASRFAVANVGAAIVAIGTLVGLGALIGYGYGALSQTLGWIVGALALVAAIVYVVWFLRRARATKAGADLTPPPPS